MEMYMRYLNTYKLFESNNDIDDIQYLCREYGIKNYTINEDGTIDVEGDVNLNSKILTRLPIKFRNVSGHFLCNHNRLTSFEGFPVYVGASLQCNNNRLTSFIGCPINIGRSFWCSSNRISSFEGFPESIGNQFYCHDNPIYDVYLLFNDDEVSSEYMNTINVELFNEFDIIRDGDTIILDRLNDFLQEIGSTNYPVESVEGWKCI